VAACATIRLAAVDLEEWAQRRGVGVGSGARLARATRRVLAGMGEETACHTGGGSGINSSFGETCEQVTPRGGGRGLGSLYHAFGSVSSPSLLEVPLTTERRPGKTSHKTQRQKCSHRERLGLVHMLESYAIPISRPVKSRALRGSSAMASALALNRHARRGLFQAHQRLSWRSGRTCHPRARRFHR
jgi:hypothetical protein